MTTCEAHGNPEECNQNFIICEKHVGITCPHIGTLSETLSHPVNFGCFCTQVVELPDSFDKKKTAEFCAIDDSSFYIHAPVKWNYAPKQDYGAHHTLKQYLSMVEGLPSAVVMHVGYGTRGGSIQNVIAKANDLQISRQPNRVEYPLLLENAAGRGTQLATTFDEMRQLSEGIDTPVGWCMDTQHLFASGACDFKDHESVVKLFDDMPPRVKLIHLNDSLVPQDKSDRHQNIRQGYIWYHNDESLKTLLGLCHEKKIDMVLETPDPYTDLQMLRDKYL